jgi:hypothetical protein
MEGSVVVTTMKNEGPFLLDWVAHHKALGFDRIVICTNDCADPTALIANRLQAMGLARHHATVFWPTTSMQRSAIKQATRMDEVRSASWVYVCDADEFLTVKCGDGTLTALLDGETADAVAVPWRVFGPAGVERFTDLPVTAQFTQAQIVPRFPAEAQTYAKSLTRGPLDRVLRLGVHLPVPRPGLEPPFRIVLPGGRPLGRQSSPMHVPADYAVAQVNHYALRSVDSFLVKRDRGRVNHMNDPMDIDYWDRFDVALVPCHAVARLAPAVAEWRARLAADRVLARLHRQSVRWHRLRAAALRQAPENAALLRGITARMDRWRSLAS